MKYFQKYKIGCGMILILALSGNFSVFAANMPDSQELIQQLGIQQQDLASINQGEIVFFNVARVGIDPRAVTAVSMDARPLFLIKPIILDGAAGK